MTGVRSLSGWVRATTRAAPEARAAGVSARGAVDVAMPATVRASVPPERLLEPLGADVGVDLRVEHQRALALLDPRAHCGQICGAAGGHSDTAGGHGERGE